jgi:hypothetical protein
LFVEITISPHIMFYCEIIEMCILSNVQQFIFLLIEDHILFGILFITFLSVFAFFFLCFKMFLLVGSHNTHQKTL